MSERDDETLDESAPTEVAAGAEEVTDAPATPEADAIADSDGSVAKLPPVDLDRDDGAPISEPAIPGVLSLHLPSSRAAFYMKDGDGTEQVWLLGLDTYAATRLDVAGLGADFTLVDDPAGPQWAPDGTRLAITACPIGGGPTHLRLLDPETGASARLVSHAAADSWPRWSPNGDMIAFVAERDGQSAIALAFPGEGLSPAIQVSKPAAGQSDREPTWDVEPTRVRLAFLRHHPEKGTDPAGDHIWLVYPATGEEKTISKRILARHSLRWGPTRPLVMHIAKDTDWENVAVINADNQASWTITSEAGDKADPQWAPDGNRVLFSRRKGGVQNVCDRATSAAASEVLDPGDGVAYSPRWLPMADADRPVLFVHRSASGAVSFVRKDNNKGTAATTTVAAPGSASHGRSLVVPAVLEMTIAGLKSGGLFYRRAEGSGPAPTVILLGARPDQGPSAAFDAAAQALAATGAAVFCPVLPGAAGFGKKVANGRKERVGFESEVEDLLDVIAALAPNAGVDEHRIAVVGEGYGGTLALLLAGSRPDAIQAVAAIDPIVDWDEALDSGDRAFRAWVLDTYGLPLADAETYTLRNPLTFAGVVAAPLLLVGKSPDDVHLGQLATGLDDLGKGYWLEFSAAESRWEAWSRIGRFLVAAFRGQLDPAAARRSPATAAPAPVNAAGVLTFDIPAESAAPAPAPVPETAAELEAPADIPAVLAAPAPAADPAPAPVKPAAVNPVVRPDDL